jgi:hypothetical protein
MNHEGWKDADSDEQRRDIAAIHLTGEPGLKGINPIAAEVAAWVRDALADLSRKRGAGENDPISDRVGQTVSRATETALGALEGRLKKASLEGEFKEAEILKLYAEMRVANATAVKLEEETEQIRLANARARLENALAAAQAFGLDVRVLIGSDLPPVIAAGDNLTIEETLDPSSHTPEPESTDH